MSVGGVWTVANTCALAFLFVAGLGVLPASAPTPPVVSGAHPAAIPLATMYNVSGWITDSLSLAAVAGATVSANTGPTTLSNASGFYTLSIGKGTVTIAITAIGYHTSTFTVTVNGNIVNQNRTIRPYTYAVTGSVIDARTGLGIVGAVVIILPIGLTNRTSAAGAYRILTENGSFTMTATALGYDAAQVPLYVAGQPVSRYFLLNSTSLGSDVLPPTELLEISLTLGVGFGVISYIVVALREGERLRRRTQPLAGIPVQRFTDFDRRPQEPSQNRYLDRRRRR